MMSIWKNIPKRLRTDASWLPDWVVATLENSVEIRPRDWLEGLLPYAYGVITHRTGGNLAKVEGFRRALARLSSSGSLTPQRQ